MSVSKVVGRTSQLFRLWAVLGAVALAAVILVLLSPLEGNAVATLPSGFQESVVFSGLTKPTNVEFSKDGRVFVAEKSGLIKVFDNLSDTTPTTFADLRTKVLIMRIAVCLGWQSTQSSPPTPTCTCCTPMTR